MKRPRMQVVRKSEKPVRHRRLRLDLPARAPEARTLTSAAQPAAMPRVQGGIELETNPTQPNKNQEPTVKPLHLTAAAFASLFLASAALADNGDAIEERLDQKGDRIEERLDRKGDRIDRRLDRRADVAEANGHERRAERLDRTGDRIDRRLDRRGEHIDRRLDRRGARIERRLDRRGH